MVESSATNWQQLKRSEEHILECGNKDIGKAKMEKFGRVSDSR